MTLFKNTSSKLEGIKENPFKLEREIQRLFENNLPLIMGLELVKSEFTIKNKRIEKNCDKELVISVPVEVDLIKKE